MQFNHPLAGIDYGSKMSGHTMIAWLEAESLIVSWKRSEKGRSADDFLHTIINTIQPYMIGLDAPLSLPGIYRCPEEYNDYFYRKADRECQAMSPMFIGGLTARAIKLRDELASTGLEHIYEVYPKQMAMHWNLEAIGYKKNDGDATACLSAIKEFTGWQFPSDAPTWHHVDAVLALASCMRVALRQAIVIGDPAEGLIHY